MQDRVSQYPGRVKLTPVSGQENVYDMEWADGATVEGTALNKANLLGDLAAEVYSLDTETATVNDAFLAVSRKFGMFPVFLHITVGGETPLAGLPIAGVTHIDGSPIVTDGINTDYFCIAESASVNITMNGGYLDLPNASVSGTFQGESYLDLTLTIPAKTAQTKVFNSSSNIKFSPYTKTVDVCCVGGGGGGGGSYSAIVGASESSSIGRGGGGGGGRLVNQNGVTVNADTTYSIVVGSGGSAGKTTTNNNTTTSGGDGGTSSFGYTGNILVSAAGGSGGKKADTTADQKNGSGGSGNGRGGNGASDGSDSTDGYILGLSSLGKAGGGGGGGNATDEAREGGAPNGGSGAYYLQYDSQGIQIQNAKAGTAPGGGGGGGFSRHYNNSTIARELVNGAAGGRGAVYVSWGA